MTQKDMKGLIDKLTQNFQVHQSLGCIVVPSTSPLVTTVPYSYTLPSSSRITVSGTVFTTADTATFTPDLPPKEEPQYYPTLSQEIAKLLEE